MGRRSADVRSEDANNGPKQPGAAPLPEVCISRVVTPSPPTSAPRPRPHPTERPQRGGTSSAEAGVEARRREGSHGLSAGRGPTGQLGRYVMMRKLGEGAMGLVMAAFDPDLERKVALKLLRGTMRDGSAGAARIRREAQAMARLSHPNVAQVYEVADDNGQLFLAMEYIEGATLREWLAAEPRPWREVLRVYAEAGRGLAAAHAAGLLHRDFKSDNAMLAADGRVRVLDFGLSRLHDAADAPAASNSEPQPLHLTNTGALVGTPAYMAPEQHKRQNIDARSDQFSFCVALWEALYGLRPFAGATMSELVPNVLGGRIAAPPTETGVPSWVRTVLERGLAVEPALRWPTMDALLAALSHDPWSARRRWAVALGGVTLVAAAGYAAAAYRAAATSTCRGAAEELLGTWDPTRRAAVQDAVRTSGGSLAEGSATATDAYLDAYASRWVTAHTTSCVAHQRGHLSPHLFDRRMACLRHRRSELAATIAVLEQTTPESVAQALDAARGLPAVELCADDERLLAAVEPPEAPGVALAVEEARGRLARPQALERGGRYTEALAEVQPMVEEAERLDYPPYRAEVHLLAGRLHMHTTHPVARVHIELALQTGLAARADAVAAEALALQVFQLASNEHRPREALVLGPLGRALLQRIGDPPRLVALLHNNVAIALSENGEGSRAIAEYEASLALLVEHAPDDPLRWAVVNNLANRFNAAGEYERTRTLVTDTLAVFPAHYGQCHPAAAALRHALADANAATDRLDEAVTGYSRALACYEGYPGYMLTVLGDLGEVHLRRGDPQQAQTQVDRADALVRRHPDAKIHASPIGILRVRLALHRRDPGAARRALDSLIADLEATRRDGSDELASLAALREEVVRLERPSHGADADRHEALWTKHFRRLRARMQSCSWHPRCPRDRG